MHTVIIGFLRAFFYGIDYPGHITQEDVRSIVSTDYDIRQLPGIIELSFHSQRVGFTTDIEVTTGNVLVLRSDNGADGFDGQVVCFQLVRVAIYLNLTLRSTTDGYSSDSRNTRQGVNHTVVQYFVKRRLALIGLYGKQHDRNHIRTELEDDRILDIVGKLRAYHVEFIAHIIGQNVNIVTELELQRNQ